MTDVERKAARSLFPYFSKDPVVVDVGSNVGDWAEILVNNVSSMYLFEPNTILRHYSQVRFRQFKHVNYQNVAVSYKTGWADFSYFEDKHDGLSNIINNPKWEYLNPKTTQIPTVSLDDFFIPSQRAIDFIKIDVEGAELLVLRGAEKLLASKAIRFIQVEHAEHIEVTGKTFADLVVYVRQFGYDVFHFDGVTFTKWINQEAENLYIMDANFSDGWNKEFRANTAGMKFDFVLEIGAFEGLTSKYICENLLNPEGRMIVVDPLTDEYLPGHKDNAMFVGQYERFIKNTQGLPIELIRKKSNEVLTEMWHYRFNLIYVDGDHTQEGVHHDGRLAFQLCRVGGFILFDDYDGYLPETTAGVNKFLADIPEQKLTIVKRGYQLMIQKLENLD